jgi:hypothetical protein
VTLKEALATKLKAVTAGPVFPSFVPMNDDGTFDHLPATAYRLVGGTRYTAGDIGNTGFGTETFLVEVFDQDATVCEQKRKLIETAFPGRNANSDVQSPPVRWGPNDDPGPWIYWAIAADPESDGTVPQTDAHLTLHFEQILVSITFQE